MRKTGWIIGLLCMGVLSTAALPPSAFAANLPLKTSLLEQEVDVSHNGLEIDSQSYARDFSVTEEEALSRLQIQDALSTQIEGLSEAAGERLAGAFIQQKPNLEAVIRLTGNAKLADLDRIAAAADVPIRIEYGAEHSQEELDSLVERTDWDSLSDDIQGVYADVQTGEIVFDIFNSGVKSADTKNLLRTLPVLEGLPTRVNLSSEPSGDTNRGGRNLRTCTSAFTVRNVNNGVWGVLTAGHCSSPQPYFWFTGEGPFAMNLWDERRTSVADIEWHTTSAQPTEALFHANSTTVARPQQGKGVGQVGQYLCRRGKTTGYNCGTVTSITYRPTYDGACPKTTCSAVFSLANIPTSGGDSGGPWFIGNTPHGITKGSIGGTHTVFTRVWYLNTMGVEVVQH